MERRVRGNFHARCGVGENPEIASKDYLSLLADTVLGQIFDWVYARIVEFLGEFFTMMNGMGTELFELAWVQAVVEFFGYFAWALYVVGLAVGVFEAAVEYQSGRASAVRDLALGSVKGFLAVSLFTSIPVELYKLCVDLQGSLSKDITGVSHIDGISSYTQAAMGALNGYGTFISLFLLILMGYAVIKVFFANLKRGGILLIQIAVGALYMFSVPRGYTDGFTQWCKQIVGLCLTAFLQATILTAGLMVFSDHALLGLGLMLSAGEVPRIAGAFGLDTSTKASLTSAVHTAQMAVSTTKVIASAVGGK